MLQICPFVCNAFQQQSYLVYDEVTHDAFLVDAGMASEAECNRLIREIERLSLRLNYILLTHSHLDHVLGTGFLSRTLDVPVLGSIADQQFLPPAARQSLMFGMGIEPDVAAIDRDLRDGDVLWLGSSQPDAEGRAAGHEIRVLDCPGHSYHGLCYYLPHEKMLFSGDVLFFGSVGRSDFGPAMGCDGRMLRETIIQKLLVLPADVDVFPGHGPQTTIGREATANPYL